MKIYHHRYTHQPLPGKTMSGALIRIQYGMANEGFADLHPWTEYGDPSLEKLLADMPRWTAKKKLVKFEPVISKAFHFAELDAWARRCRRNLLFGIDLPSSHALVAPFDDKAVREASEKRFTCLKIKANGDVDEAEWLARLPESFKLRLDFGGRLKFTEFRSWWSEASAELRERINAVEDPWKDGTEVFIPGCPIYGDWIDNPMWDGKVFKPARDRSMEDFRQNGYRRVLFTHSLDHPLGRAAAIYEAAEFYIRYPEQPGGFSGWGDGGPVLKPAVGTGFGFDEELHSLNWERLL